MSDFSDALNQALENKKNDVNSFTWKGPKCFVNGKRVQEEFKLIDATEKQLKNCMEHCKSMLYSKDKDNPGRKELINIIRDQETRINAELYIRDLRKQKIVPLQFRQTIVDYLNKDEVKSVIPRSSYKTTMISKIIKTPDEFSAIPIDIILDACLCSLGIFQRNHITNNFLVKLGLWFTKDEIKDYLSQKDENGKLLDRLDQVKSNLNLRSDIKLHTNYNGGLSYLEFRAMHNMKNDRYENYSDVVLNTLKNKVLPRLEDEVRAQAEFWENKIAEINKVAEIKGITLN